MIEKAFYSLGIVILLAIASADLTSVCGVML